MKFTPEWLSHSEVAVRNGIDNTPPAAVLPALAMLGAWLERIEELLAHQITHSSGYRCPALNILVHGAADSAHLHGWAEDFICPQYGTPLEIVQHLRDSGLVFDQLIQEGTWVHVSFDPRARNEVLTAHFVAGVKTVYTPGA